MMRFEKEDWRERMIPEEGVLNRQKMRRQRVWFRKKGSKEIERIHKERVMDAVKCTDQ